MDQRELEAHIRAGEGMSAEFKRCGSKPERDFFETVCSFANRQGGNIFLGVEDDGTVSGVPPESATDIKRNMSNVLNNPNLFRPSPLVEVEDVTYGGSSCSTATSARAPATSSSASSSRTCSCTASS